VQSTAPSENISYYKPNFSSLFVFIFLTNSISDSELLSSFKIRNVCEEISRESFHQEGNSFSYSSFSLPIIIIIQILHTFLNTETSITSFCQAKL